MNLFGLFYDEAVVGDLLEIAIRGIDVGKTEYFIFIYLDKRQLKELKKKYRGCPTGNAVITSGGKLKAKYVIHAVGPVYSGKSKDAELLANAYRSSLKLCTKHGIRSISFPSISTGVYGYPVEKAAPIAVNTTRNYLNQHPEIELVRFVLFDDRTLQAYQEAYSSLVSPPLETPSQPSNKKELRTHGHRVKV